MRREKARGSISVCSINPFFMWQHPPAGKELAASAACFVLGASLFVWGVHLSYANVGPQQARIKARSDLLRDHLRRKYGYEAGKYIHGHPSARKRLRPHPRARSDSASN